MRGETVLERILEGDEEPKDLPLALLQHITNDFCEERKIGQGGFGDVYKGVLRNGLVVAVKRIHINVDTVDDKLFRREFNSLWKANNHQNVVRFLGFCSNSYQTRIQEAGSEEIKLANVRERLLCFEYISNGSLDKHITDELRGLEWETRYGIIIGICNGLCHLKEKNIIHMDLKPANILLDDHMVPKITDFGLSRPNESSHTIGQRFGTRGYLAPEYENAGKTLVKSDIYSLGAIIIELVTGCMGAPDKINVLRRWRHRWSKPPTLLQYQQVTRCIDIAARCRQQEPGLRPSISEIISSLIGPESTDVHTGQVSPYFDEDDMLGIKPLELQLSSELKEEISCFTVELTNDTRSCIAFNIQLPSRQQYSAQPDIGIVQPQSKYGVKITVQARDAHEYDHADEFIMQSMKLSDGLRDMVFTESMFHEEAGKVVDEVNLMVVYAPTKPQENCKSREDTNTPEEVLEVRKSRIVDSASGKGKLVSNENAETSLVRHKDINSSTREHYTEQTERYKFYQPRSFSCHYPTNTTYLGKGSRAVDVARGAMGSLLDKLGKLVKEDYNLERSMKRDIESFSEDLAKIHKDLPKLEKLDGLKIWVDEVRELSYNIEDMVDSFLLHVELDSSSSGFREFPREGLKFLENDMITHRPIGDVIRDIKNHVQAVADRQKKYNFSVNDVIADPTAKAPIDPRMAKYINKKQLVGIEAPTDELIRLFGEDGGVSKQELKIVSIVGLGGLGKTTLARAVYDKLKAQYHCRAFVSVGQNPDVKKVLMNILFALGKKFNDLDVLQLIEELQKLLEDRRYFIVIDDIWDSEAWDPIQSAFPENSLGSRVITTTRIHPVALATCSAKSKFVYRMKSLSPEDSRRLFLRRIFGSEEASPDTPREEEISVDILKKCGGMPLAIISIASLLAGEPASTWDYVRKTMGAMTDGDDVEKMKQILDLSYIHLPDHLKTCLLYVCMYPEDREIDKFDLLRQWVAEGFVITNGRLDAVDLAEKYFKELINMCMLEPGKIDDYNNEVLSCRVHDIILDLMRSKSSKENFIHVIDGSKDETGQIRRVAFHYNDKEDTGISGSINKGSLSHVRLFLLRYLKVAPLRPFGYSLKLPNKIGGLQQLETMDLDYASLEKYPSDIASLPWLSHLSSRANAEGGIALPDRIDRLTSLCTLEGVCIYRSSVENIKGLGKLTNLRKLAICSAKFRQTMEEEEEIMRVDALHSSICMLASNLRILTFGISSEVSMLDVGCWSSSSPFPQVSHIRELNLLCCEFEKCPEWIGQLHHLYKFLISVKEVADGFSIVARLPSLAYFKLVTFVKEEKEESVVIPGRGAFQALKHLIFHCEKVSLTFEEGAMPKLEKLDMQLRWDMTCEFLPVGIDHLQAGTLKEIWLRVHWHPSCPVEGSQDFDDDVCSAKCNDNCEHKEPVRRLLEGAFKPHHHTADISISFVDYCYVGDEFDEEDGDNELTSTDSSTSDEEDGDNESD
uniref:Disease resistance protein RPP13 n=1 Tax=Aegilops tauschii subsp. strangulata TaxID=200361 RepID=A0A452XHZ8_AEGTS